MSRINTPTNQKLLTNVAVVRMKKAGKRFEIACYKNKVLSWRQGTEKDLDEVLQSHTVFTNVSKGQVANKEDLKKAFGADQDHTQICKTILAKGDLQVSDKERQAQQDALFREIATTIADKCVNPENKQPYPVSIIEKAMKECHIAVKPNRPAKQQALDAIPKINESMKIERAQMRIKIQADLTHHKVIAKLLKQLKIQPEKEEKADGVVFFVLLVDPGNYRKLEEMLKESTKGQGILELMDLKEVKDEGEALLSST